VKRQALKLFSWEQFNDAPPWAVDTVTRQPGCPEEVVARIDDLVTVDGLRVIVDQCN